MGGVDLANQMHRFYTCTHRSSCKWYFRLFWFLLDLAIDNAYVLECWTRDRTPGQGRRKNKELATELLSKYSSRKLLGARYKMHLHGLRNGIFQTS